jgi:hypothetical protein
MTAKIIERSPLKYPVVRAVSCFVPSTILNNRTLAETRFRDLLQILFTTNHINAVTADSSKCQFSSLCDKASSDNSAQFSTFSTSKDRLDTFYYTAVGDKADFTQLFSVIRLILVLSHGNASVESGFSVNSDMLVENLREESLVAQRIVYDAMQAAGGLTAININKSMLQFVRGAHGRYTEALARKRQAQSEQNKKTSEKKRVADAIKVLEAKKVKMNETVAVESRKLEMEIAELKKMTKLFVYICR